MTNLDKIKALSTEADLCAHLAKENKNNSKDWWLARESGVRYAIIVLEEKI